MNKIEIKCRYCGKPLYYRDESWFHVGSGSVCDATSVGECCTVLARPQKMSVAEIKQLVQAVFDQLEEQEDEEKRKRYA